MPLYRFQSGSPLDEVTILSNESGGTRAYLHASAQAAPDQLAKIQGRLDELDWKATPLTHEGKSVIEVRGFKKPELLMAELRGQDFVNGEPAITPMDGDTRTTSQKVNNATLKLAGLSYNLGDLSYLMYSGGPLLEHWKNSTKADKGFGALDVVAGLGYMSGSLMLTNYGSRDQSQNTIETATFKINRYLRKEGHSLSEDTAIQKTLKEPKRTFFGKLNHFFAKYPSECLNGIYVFVGACLSAVAFYRGTRPIEGHLLGSARTDAIAKRNSFRTDVGLGLVTAASAIAGLTIKEKKPIEGEPKRKGLAGVWDWIQEKPLRATGYGYMIATLFHAYGTVQQVIHKTEKPIYLAGRAVFIATNLLSEFLLAISSKGHGTGVKPDSSIDQTVIATTAEYIFRQPEAKREVLVEQLAGYMASSEVLGGKAEIIANDLRSQIAGLEKNPWAIGSKITPASPAIVAKDTLGTVNDNGKPGTTISAATQAQMLTQEQPQIVKSPW